MRRRLTPLRVGIGIVAVLLVTVIILVRIPAGEYIFLPDIAHPVAPLVHVEGAHPAKGGALYFVDVQLEQASELDVLFPSLHSHATFVPTDEVVPPGATSQEFQNAAIQQMATSKQIAAAVAERQLGYHVVAKPTGALVDFVDPKSHAAGKLQLTDVIVAVDGSPAQTLPRLHSLLGQVKPGAVVALRVRRGSHLRTVRVKTVAEHGQAIIGIEVEQAKQIALPIHVSIDTGNIGGPSAGLAFALEVMEKLGRNVVNGYRVAATGEMELNGAIAPIGGVEQKTYGVREAGAEVFLVPAGGGNAATARRYAGPVHIIAVRTFAQALHALATLPPK